MAQCASRFGSVSEIHHGLLPRRRAEYTANAEERSDQPAQRFRRGFAEPERGKKFFHIQHPTLKKRGGVERTVQGDSLGAAAAQRAAGRTRRLRDDRRAHAYMTACGIGEGSLARAVRRVQHRAAEATNSPMHARTQRD